MKGGTFINTVIKTLNLTATGTPIVFAAGAKLLIVKGFSQFYFQDFYSLNFFFAKIFGGSFFINLSLHQFF